MLREESFDQEDIQESLGLQIIEDPIPSPKEALDQRIEETLSSPEYAAWCEEAREMMTDGETLRNLQLEILDPDTALSMVMDNFNLETELGQDPATVVDLGCCSGFHTALLQTRFPRHSFVGVDLIPDLFRAYGVAQDSQLIEGTAEKLQEVLEPENIQPQVILARNTFIAGYVAQMHQGKKLDHILHAMFRGVHKALSIGGKLLIWEEHDGAFEDYFKILEDLKLAGYDFQLEEMPSLVNPVDYSFSYAAMGMMEGTSYLKLTKV